MFDFEEVDAKEIFQIAMGHRGDDCKAAGKVVTNQTVDDISNYLIHEVQNYRSAGWPVEIIRVFYDPVNDWLDSYPDSEYIPEAMYSSCPVVALIDLYKVLGFEKESAFTAYDTAAGDLNDLVNKWAMEYAERILKSINSYLADLNSIGIGTGTEDNT